uniref:Uncharacterized protein n=1 Tax=Rhizophora mucronata TaxID=61149 RepID=A0A2P2QRX2_RHIMU
MKMFASPMVQLSKGLSSVCGLRLLPCGSKDTIVHLLRPFQEATTFCLEFI